MPESDGSAQVPAPSGHQTAGVGHLAARIVPLTMGLIPAVVDCARTVWHAAYDDLLPAGQVEYMLAGRTEHSALATYVGATDRWFDVALADQGGPDPAQVQADPVRSDDADDTVVLGYTSCRIKTLTTLRLEQIYLRPGLWGQGMADALLDRVLDHARECGASAVDLTVNRENARALAFYRKRHFVLMAEIVTDIGGGFVMDDYVLVRSI